MKPNTLVRFLHRMGIARSFSMVKYYIEKGLITWNGKVATKEDFEREVKFLDLLVFRNDKEHRVWHG